MIRDRIFQNIGIEKGANLGSVEAFAKILLVAIPSLEGGYPELFLLFSPSGSIILERWTPS
jgi:hypothetical protein